MARDNQRTEGKRLDGKTAIVTGASAGIGRATALALAAEGAAVVLNARRRERLIEVAAEIAALGGKALVAPGDAGKAEEIDALLAQTLSWADGGNSYHIVVVNAGRGLAGGLLASDEGQWEALYRTNVLGAAHLMRQAGRYLEQQGRGDIVALGSVAGRNISPVSAVYGATKFAMAGLVEGLRRELCGHGVRVSLVMPGIVTSEFQQMAGYDTESFGTFAAQFGTLLEPGNIAEGIRWLLTLPPHVHVNEIMIRPTGQSYP
ncbi:SDR family oxidoreductase [Desulfobulbus sp.]|uniref:SDR family oxidoreductase n=1 Tax=Desulfobulbus sp. TaxID=895 RepID=UPI00286F0311|nr:SDR family oxidoreductase [Desulfobulbus sp.]